MNLPYPHRLYVVGSRSIRLLFLGCFLLSDPPHNTSRCYAIFRLLFLQRVDFNHLEICAAARFYCEYKTWERIHRSIADLRLLVIPASWSRVADFNPNWRRFYKDCLHLAISEPVVTAIVLCVQPRVSEGHADLASSSPSSPWDGSETRYMSSDTFHGAVSADTCNSQRGLRSLPHLREQFKPRTDDDHATPV